MADNLAREVIHDWEEGDGERGTWLSHWQDIGNHLLPNRADYITQRAPGAKRMQWIYDSAPLTALDESASGLHSYLTSPYLPWFALHADDDRRNRIQRVRDWFDRAGAVMYLLFNGPRHNFASQSYETYLDLLSVGTAVMSVLDSQKSGVLFSTRHLRECVLFENDEDRIDKLCRKWEFTGKQAWQKFGDKAGEAALKAYAANDNQRKFTYFHRVQPRVRRDRQRNDRRNMAFESVYARAEDQAVVDEAGFQEFPYLAARFAKASGEIYGRGPGVLQLPDIKMLYEFKKLLLKGAQKVVDPPLMLPDDGFVVPIRTTPGGLNYYRAGTRPTDRIAAIETKGNIQLGIEIFNGLITGINRGFYVDYLRLPSDPSDPGASGKGVTATWVLQQRDEKMRLLSPMLSRLQSEFLDPLISRTFAILWRKSALLGFGPGSPFPPPPPELRGEPWHVEYLSPIAIAQASSTLDAIKRLMQTQLELKQIDPMTPTVLDGEAIMRLEAQNLNAPAAALKSPERMLAEQQKAAQMQEQQHQAEIGGQVADAAQKGTGAVVNLAQARAQAMQNFTQRLAA